MIYLFWYEHYIYSIYIISGYHIADNIDLGPVLYDGDWYPFKIWNTPRILTLKLISEEAIEEGISYEEMVMPMFIKCFICWYVYFATICLRLHICQTLALEFCFLFYFTFWIRAHVKPSHFLRLLFLKCCFLSSSAC
jgi:hypothetical protein